MLDFGFRWLGSFTEQLVEIQVAARQETRGLYQFFATAPTLLR